MHVPQMRLFRSVRFRWAYEQKNNVLAHTLQHQNAGDVRIEFGAVPEESEHRETLRGKMGS